MSDSASSSVSIPSPKASRRTRPRWLDPKLFLGVLLVLGSMAFGAQIIGQANRSTPVLRAKVDIQAGEPIHRDMLEETPVRFIDAPDAKKYTSPQAFKGEGVPAGARSASHIRAGELLPIEAITTARPGSVQKIAVTAPSLPADLEVGDRVDLWLVPKPDSGTSGGTGSGEAGKPGEPGEPGEDDAQVVAKNVQVLRVPQEGDTATSPTITLEITGRTEFDPRRFYDLQRTLQVRIHEIGP